MTSRRPVRRTALAALTSLALLSVAACGSSKGSDASSNEGGKYPVTVSNCGAKVEFKSAPKSVVMLKASAVPFLAEIGVLDQVKSKAGSYPKEYYDAVTNKALDKIPSLTDKLNAGGHLQISKEAVLNEEPDLVMGEVDNLNRDTLEAVGVPLLEEPALCKDGIENPGMGAVYSQLTMYGKVFNREAAATKAIAKLKTEEADVRRIAAKAKPRTAAVLYPTVGGGVTYAYGNKSMADPQLKMAGFTNVFGNVDKRVFEVTTEELLGRNPDVIIALHSDGAPGKVADAVTGLPGADRLKAVRDGNVMPMLFNFSEPPTPLAIEGVKKIQKRFDIK